jgi:hypothetical protein
LLQLDLSMNGRLPKMMLAFVVRRCTVELGRLPTAAEFAQWANNQGDDGDGPSLFGRPISNEEAGLILKHRSRLVTAKSAAPGEEHVERDEWEIPRGAAGNVVRLVDVRERLASAGVRRERK